VSRHRQAAEELLAIATTDTVTASALRGLCDRWDDIERTGDGTGQLGQLAPIVVSIAQSLTLADADVLAQLIAELSGG